MLLKFFPRTIGENMKKYKLVTNIVDKELKGIEKKDPREWKKLSTQLAQLEASGDSYPYTPEREYRGLKTKYYRILYKIYDEYIVCLVMAKKQGQKLENYHYDLADVRSKKFKKQLETYSNNRMKK